MSLKFIIYNRVSVKVTELNNHKPSAIFQSKSCITHQYISALIQISVRDSTFTIFKNSIMWSLLTISQQSKRNNPRNNQFY